MARTPGKEVESQQARAYALSVAGYAYGEIAQMLNITSKQVYNLIAAERHHLAQFITDDDRQARIHLEVERLDALQARYWASAMMGETKDAEFVLKLIQARIKLLQLDGGQQHTTNQILVAGGDKEEFMAILKAAQTSGLARDNEVVEAEVLEEEE